MNVVKWQHGVAAAAAAQKQQRECEWKPASAHSVQPSLEKPEIIHWLSSAYWAG